MRKKNALDLIESHSNKKLVTVSSSEPLSRAISLMKQFGISQIPVTEDGNFVGSLSDNVMYGKIIENPMLKELPINHVMEEPFPEVSSKEKVDKISKMFNTNTKAIIVNYGEGEKHIITLQDMINVVGS